MVRGRTEVFVRVELRAPTIPTTVPAGDATLVTLDSGRRITLNMDAVIHTPEANAPVKSIPLGTVDVKPVGAVARAYELWAKRPK